QHALSLGPSARLGTASALVGCVHDGSLRNHPLPHGAAPPAVDPARAARLSDRSGAAGDDGEPGRLHGPPSQPRVPVRLSPPVPAAIAEHAGLPLPEPPEHSDYA